jgi:hypothetical protein
MRKLVPNRAIRSPDYGADGRSRNEHGRQRAFARRAVDPIIVTAVAPQSPLTSETDRMIARNTAFHRHVRERPQLLRIRSAHLTTTSLIQIIDYAGSGAILNSLPEATGSSGELRLFFSISAGLFLGATCKSYNRLIEKYCNNLEKANEISKFTVFSCYWADRINCRLGCALGRGIRHAYCCR